MPKCLLFSNYEATAYKSCRHINDERAKLVMRPNQMAERIMANPHLRRGRDSTGYIYDASQLSSIGHNIKETFVSEPIARD